MNTAGISPNVGAHQKLLCSIVRKGQRVCEMLPVRGRNAMQGANPCPHPRAGHAAYKYDLHSI